MKTKYIMFPRNGIYYCEDTSTGKQTSLRTRDEAEAKSLLNAKNEAVRQPVLNLHIARAYLTASDPAYTQRTWQSVMNQFQARGRETSRERYATVFKSKAFNDLRGKILLETTAEDFFAVFKYGKESITYFLKSLHNFALSLGWLPTPILAPFLWPKYKPKLRRGITLDEHQRIIAGERHAERRLFYQLLWATGAAQSDAAALTAENIDWPSRTLTYFRKKTGSRAQLSIGRDLEEVLNHLPTTGILFPRYSTLPANTRACLFGRRCKELGVTGVSLHCYRYAWAERAKVAGIPERFAQCALGSQQQSGSPLLCQRGGSGCPVVGRIRSKGQSCCSTSRACRLNATGKVKAVESVGLNRFWDVLGILASPNPATEGVALGLHHPLALASTLLRPFQETGKEYDFLKQDAVKPPLQQQHSANHSPFGFSCGRSDAANAR